MADDKLAKTLEENFQQNTKDPDAYDDEKAARQKKVRPLSSLKGRLPPPPLDEHGAEKE